MKVKRIEITNFRQFNGSHSIDFSLDDAKNITVIHGENGGGKTTLLNAFKWAFYGVTDLDPDEERKLLNTQALREAKDGGLVVQSVKIQFEHDGKNYEIMRSHKYTRSGDVAQPVDHPAFVLSYNDPEEGYVAPANPEVQIKKILPEKLHPYFFFHGERIEKLATYEGTTQVKEAVRNLMGIETFERALNHLDNKVKKHYKAELKRNSSPQDQDLIVKIDGIDADITNRKDEITALNKTIAECKVDIAEIDKKLEANRASEEMKKRRAKIDSDIKFIDEQLKALSDDNKHLINKKGFLAFFKDSAARVHTILEDKRKKGELPYKVKKQFIDDLLKQGTCICGTELVKGTHPHDEILKFATNAGGADLEEGYNKTSSAVHNAPSDSNELKRQLKDNLKAISEFHIRKKTLNTERDGISDKLTNSESEEVAELEKRRKVLETKESQCHHDIGDRNREILTKTEQLKELKEKLKTESEKDEQFKKAERKLAIASECRDALQRIIDAFSNEVREKLSEKVNETVDKILRNEYKARIKDDYTLLFEQKTPQGIIDVPALSSGQKVVASLSFIASIINVAKKKYTSDNTSEYFLGGLYPLVMDTPFGNADDDHSNSIAKHIPELAEQVIILVSNKNWSPEIHQICRGKIGKEYSIVHYSPEPKNKLNERYEKKSDTGWEHSKIMEGYYG